MISRQIKTKNKNHCRRKAEKLLVKLERGLIPMDNELLDKLKENCGTKVQNKQLEALAKEDPN